MKNYPTLRLSIFKVHKLFFTVRFLVNMIIF